MQWRPAGRGEVGARRVEQLWHGGAADGQMSPHPTECGQIAEAVGVGCPAFARRGR